MKFTDVWGKLADTEVTLTRVQSEKKILKNFDEFFQIEEGESNIQKIKLPLEISKKPRYLKE
jgi:uncharacterized protein VirK/YbjX